MMGITKVRKSGEALFDLLYLFTVLVLPAKQQGALAFYRCHKN